MENSMARPSARKNPTSLRWDQPAADRGWLHMVTHPDARGPNDLWANEKRVVGFFIQYDRAPAHHPGKPVLANAYVLRLDPNTRAAHEIKLGTEWFAEVDAAKKWIERKVKARLAADEKSGAFLEAGKRAARTSNPSDASFYYSAQLRRYYPMVWDVEERRYVIPEDIDVDTKHGGFATRDAALADARRRVSTKKNPRYASGPYAERVKLPGWSGKAGLEHATAPRIRHAFGSTNHEAALEKAIVHANAAARAYNRTMKAAIAKHGDPQPWISGIGSDAFPEATKKLLRKQLDAFNRAQDAAGLHYKATGKRTPFYKSEYAHRLVKAGGYGLGATKSNPKAKKNPGVASAWRGAKAAVLGTSPWKVGDRVHFKRGGEVGTVREVAKGYFGQPGSVLVAWPWGYSPPTWERDDDVVAAGAKSNPKSSRKSAKRPARKPPARKSTR